MQWKENTITIIMILDEVAALSSIVENDGVEHLKMLEGQVINELLQQKWKVFARVSGKWLFSKGLPL